MLSSVRVWFLHVRTWVCLRSKAWLSARVSRRLACMCGLLAAAPVLLVHAFVRCRMEKTYNIGDVCGVSNACLRCLPVQHASFKIDAGSMVGFVGASGCGKSTIVRLLLRYYDVSSGEVCVCVCVCLHCIPFVVFPRGPCAQIHS